ncbi:unnamed protein product [Anisakis simplex]|uniref:Uncharacterized protein n=1 Tax=Anisakis simplex TaxID=6269 RepID=A0A3P6RGM5_ANISI|nr:unnamed protein product [Anisakis simplex]
MVPVRLPTASYFEGAAEENENYEQASRQPRL